jgi:hypothetical protein
MILSTPLPTERPGRPACRRENAPQDGYRRPSLHCEASSKRSARFAQRSATPADSLGRAEPQDPITDHQLASVDRSPRDADHVLDHGISWAPGARLPANRRNASKGPISARNPYSREHNTHPRQFCRSSQNAATRARGSTALWCYWGPDALSPLLERTNGRRETNRRPRMPRWSAVEYV